MNFLTTPNQFGAVLLPIYQVVIFAKCYNPVESHIFILNTLLRQYKTSNLSPLKLLINNIENIIRQERQNKVAVYKPYFLLEIGYLRQPSKNHYKTKCFIKNHLESVQKSFLKLPIFWLGIFKSQMMGKFFSKNADFKKTGHNFFSKFFSG